MAKLDYSSYESVSTKTNSKQRSNVGYFNSLKDNNDSTIVRFAYSSPAEFDIVTVHKVQVDGKWKSVSCLKGPYDAVDNCPLCKAGVKLNRKIYIKLIEYVKDANGQVVAQPKIWERPAEGKNDFAKKLANFINVYGDLRNMVFQIVRNGYKGSMDTTYDILPVNAQIYPENIYVKNFSDFDSLDLAHHSYLEKNFDELSQYVATGSFPAKKVETTTPVVPSQATVVTTPVTPTVTSVAPQTVAPTPTTTAEVDPTVARPRRTVQF